MNYSSIFGFLAAIGVFVFAIFSSADDWSLFFNPHALLIVLGGTIAVSVICFPIGKILGLTGLVLRRILGRTQTNTQSLIHEIVLLSQAARKGTLEAEIAKVTDPFLKSAASLLLWAGNEVSYRDLRHLLETRVATQYEKRRKEAHVFHVLSRFPPAFGLLGTTLGMIVLLRSIGTGGSQLLGSSMSIALVATFYGLLLANFVFIPIGENLNNQSEEDLNAHQMVIEAILLIGRKKPTVYVEEMAKSFVSNYRRRPRPKSEPLKRAA